MGSVPELLAVDGVGVRLRSVLPGVGVAREVVSALEPGAVVGGRIRRRGGLGERIRGAFPTEGGVGVVDPAVDDGDLDALSGVAGAARALPDVRGADVGHALGVAPLLLGDGLHALDPVDRLDVGQLTAVDRHPQTVVGGLQAVLDGAAQNGHLRGHLLLGLAEIVLYLLFLALTQGTPVARLDDRDGILLELHHDRDRTLLLEDLLGGFGGNLGLGGRLDQIGHVLRVRCLVGESRCHWGDESQHPDHGQ